MSREIHLATIKRELERLSVQLGHRVGGGDKRRAMHWLSTWQIQGRTGECSLYQLSWKRYVAGSQWAFERLLLPRWVFWPYWKSLWGGNQFYCRMLSGTLLISLSFPLSLRPVFLHVRVCTCFLCIHFELYSFLCDVLFLVVASCSFLPCLFIVNLAICRATHFIVWFHPFPFIMPVTGTDKRGRTMVGALYQVCKSQVQDGQRLLPMPRYIQKCTHV